MTTTTGQNTSSSSGAATVHNEPEHGCLGDWVRTQHNQIGRVTRIHLQCPQDDDWIELQSIPVTDDQRTEPWVSVLVHDGGSVVQPRSTVEVLTDHPARLNNRCSDFYFRSDHSASR
jgi:hypothetical protein